MLDRMLLVKLVVVLMLPFICYAVDTSAKKRTKPNVILILADDLGFDDLSFRGSNEFLTPNIDALAYHGRILDRLYAPAICTPSRAALLTGRFPIHTGTQIATLLNGATGSLPMSLTLMPELFRNAGYATSLIGKWNLGHAKREFTPSFRGFDNHYGYWGGYIDHYKRRSVTVYPCNTSIGYDFRRNLDLDCNQLGVYVTELFTTEAERIISENANQTAKPLFLMFAHLTPHAPLQAPEEEIRKFAYIKNPERRTYAAMVSILDRSVGRVVHALERAQLLENSIIIFSSDNGAQSVGEGRNAGSNWPLKGQKDTPWEGGLRLSGAIWSPLLGTSRQSIFRDPMYIGDWLPTLAAAVGLEIPVSQKLDGQNVWNALVGGTQMQKTETEKPDERVILHTLSISLHTRLPVVSYMRGPWKYVNGTMANGRFDNLLTYREAYDLDPRAERYVTEVRNSLTSKALSKFDVQRLTQHRIETLRRSAAVECGTLQRSCNALIEECLFNIEADPCEQNNLVYEQAHFQTLKELRSEIQQLKESAWPVTGMWCDHNYLSDPAWHDCTWENFLEKSPSAVPLKCTYDGSPCRTYLETAL